MKHYHSVMLPILLGAMPLALPEAAWAHAELRLDYDIPAQDLERSLRTLAERVHRQLILDDGAVAGRTAPALHGRLGLSEALAQLLAPNGLEFAVQDDAILVGNHLGGAKEDGRAAGEAIIVTGSRVRGAPPSSPVIRISQSDIRRAGFTDLGQVARSLPQSSGGGQNPGIGLGAPQGNENVTGGSSLDLRGIGADATLTLLNGHRLAYASNNQSVDISVIPVAAIEQIEILTDGASALYGSDAVGGVANISLKRSYSGLTTTARFGAATDGGDVQRQFGMVTGGRWSSGGILLAADYERDSPIVARQRDYVNSMAPDTTLLPGQKRYNVLASGRQVITDGLSLDYDALYNHRRSGMNLVLGTNDTPDTNGLIETFGGSSGALAPKLIWDTGSGWSTALAGLLAFDHTRYTVAQMAGGIEAYAYDGCYCNSARSIEVSAEGPLFALPGGAVRAAIGAGYRHDRMHAMRDGVFDYAATRNSYYGYAELFLPFVSAGNAGPFLRVLSASAAVRYEDYPSIGRIATPKLGLVYAPLSVLTLKASWGKSFKAPTLNQSYSPVYADLYYAADLGCSDCAAGATALDIYGGNQALRPERATSWSATLSYHSPGPEGLALELSYFDIAYRNRVGEPIPYYGQSFDPRYARYVDQAITSDKLTQALVGATFSDYASGDSDLSSAVAIIDDRYVNITRQTIRGLDLSARYEGGVSEHTKVSALASASYLHSRQRVDTGDQDTALSGTIYNPPKFRARAGATFMHAGLSAGAFLNRTGAVRYGEGTQALRLHGMTTADFNATYGTGEGHGAFSGIEVSLSIRNAFNVRPSTFPTTSPLVLPFDGTNYSGIGRFATLSFSKHW